MGTLVAKHVSLLQIGATIQVDGRGVRLGSKYGKLNAIFRRGHDKVEDDATIFGGIGRKDIEFKKRGKP